MDKKLCVKPSKLSIILDSSDYAHAKNWIDNEIKNHKKSAICSATGIALTTTGAYINNRSTVFTLRQFSTKGSRPLFISEAHTLAGAIACNLTTRTRSESDR